MPSEQLPVPELPRHTLAVLLPELVTFVSVNGETLRIPDGEAALYASIGYAAGALVPVPRNPKG